MFVVFVFLFLYFNELFCLKSKLYVTRNETCYNECYNNIIVVSFYVHDKNIRMSSLFAGVLKCARMSVCSLAESSHHQRVP